MRLVDTTYRVKFLFALRLGPGPRCVYAMPCPVQVMSTGKVGDILGAFLEGGDARFEQFLPLVSIVILAN